jgi:hypothetical protein
MMWQVFAEYTASAFTGGPWLVHIQLDRRRIGDPFADAGQVLGGKRWDSTSALIQLLLKD